MFFPRQSRGETLTGHRAAASRLRHLFLESYSKFPGSPWPPCSQEHAEAGQEVGGGPDEPPSPSTARAGPYPTPAMGWRHSTTLLRAAPGRWLSLFFPF